MGQLVLSSSGGGGLPLFCYYLLAVFLSFALSFVVLYPIYCFGSIFAVYRAGESVTRVLIFRGKNYITRDWCGIRWDIGLNPFGETKIWDTEVLGISRKKLHAIHYGGPKLMTLFVIVLGTIAYFAGFGNIQELPTLFLFTTLFMATVLASSGPVCWMYMSGWEKELQSK